MCLKLKISTHPQHPRDDLNGTSSHRRILNIRLWDSCVLKYVICVEPDLKLTVTWGLLIWWICQTTDRHAHTQTDALKLKVCLFFSVRSQKVALLICRFHVIHQSDHYHHADHYSCIWDTEFHQHGLLTSAPLEINLCNLINHTCWCNIHHWWGVDKIAIGAVKCCLVDLVTMHTLFHHHCRLKYTCTRRPTSKQKTHANNLKS